MLGATRIRIESVNGQPQECVLVASAVDANPSCATDDLQRFTVDVAWNQRPPARHGLRAMMQQSLDIGLSQRQFESSGRIQRDCSLMMGLAWQANQRASQVNLAYRRIR